MTNDEIRESLQGLIDRQLEIVVDAKRMIQRIDEMDNEPIELVVPRSPEEAETIRENLRRGVQGAEEVRKPRV